MKKWGILIFFLIMATEIAYAQGFGHCPFGRYPFGHCEEEVITIIPSPSPGGGAGYAVFQSPLYDVVIHITNGVKGKFEPGAEVNAEIIIINKGDTPDNDTIMTYYLSDTNNTWFGESREQFFEVDVGSLTLERNVSLPVNAGLGEWRFNVRYNTTVQSEIYVYQSFEVVEKIESTKKISANSLMLGIIVILIIIMIRSKDD